MPYLVASYNPFLLIFSAVIAIFASYTAFDLYLRRLSTHGHFGSKWSVGGSVALGIGIWSMHFTAMLADKSINHMELDYSYVWISLLISIVGSFLSLSLFNKTRSAISSGILMGITISAMHFIGLNACHQNMTLTYHIPLVSIAILIACLGSYLSFRWLKSSNIKTDRPYLTKIKYGIVVGAGISGLHYIFMSAVTMFPIGQQTQYPDMDFGMGMTMLATVVGLATLMILLFLLIVFNTGQKLAIQSFQFSMNEQYYESLFRQNPDLVLAFDLDGNFVSINKIVEFYGYSEEELLHQSFVPYIVPEELEKTVEYFNVAKEGKPIQYETTILSSDGERFDLSVTNIPIKVDNQIVGVYGILKDITERKREQEALAEAEAKYRNLAEDSLVGIYIIQNGRLVYVNRKLVEMLGYSEEEILQTNVINFIYSEDRELVRDNINTRLQDSSSNVQYQYRFVRKDKTIAYAEVHGSVTIFRGKPAVIGSVVDITDRKTAEETVDYMANYDDLTGLPNRHHFFNQLKNDLSDSTINSLAVMFIDLDQFKLVNEAMGHETGDRLLQAVSGKIKACIENQGFVARTGGDEFLVSLSNMGREEAASIAGHILHYLANPFLIGEYELYVTPSIGVSLYPHDGEDAGNLVSKANSAMVQAKRSGSNGVQFYSPTLHTSGRLELETDLRKALGRDEFLLYYQPKFDLTLGEITGVEALIRWNHRTKGLISPDKFIPLAEETGLIIPIGEWALRTACCQVKSWQKAGIKPFEVSVNLSVRQLYQPNLADRVQAILAETRLDPQYLELEVTESMMMDSDHALHILRELKNIGVKISLDDFGTGFSSLHYLMESPIDKIKIDQSFIRRSTVDMKHATIVKTMIAMAHQLNLDVIAEGVETEEHLVFLQQNSCDEAQGYLFSKPLPSEEFVRQIYEMERIVELYGIPKDVQNEKWMEQALQIARQELLDTVRLQHGMTFKFTKQGEKFIHTLCDGELLYRMNLTPEQVVGRELLDFLPASDADSKLQYYRKAWEGKENVTYEAEINDIWYIASLRPIRRGGQVVEVIASCVDITERVKKEQEVTRLTERLIEQEEKYRLIAENSDDFIAILDVNGTIQYGSPSHDRLLGISTVEREGTPGFTKVHPDDLSYTKHMFYEITATKSAVSGEWRYMKSDGSYIWVESHASPILSADGEVKSILVVARDISLRKKREEELRKSEQRYRDIAERLAEQEAKYQLIAENSQDDVSRMRLPNPSPTINIQMGRHSK